MHPRVQRPVEPTLHTLPQEYHNGPVHCNRYINGLQCQKHFSSSQTSNRLVLQRQEFSHYYNNVTEFCPPSGPDRSSTITGQGYNGEEVVKENYSAAVRLRQPPEIQHYEYGSFKNEATIEPSVNFYAYRNDIRKQLSPAEEHSEFLDRDHRQPYNALHGKEQVANQWLGLVTKKASTLQNMVFAPASLTIQKQERCERTRRNSASSTGSDVLSPSVDSGDADDNIDRCSQNRVLPPCRICGARASGFHYGVNSCEACKGFFRRALKRPMSFHCTKDNTCDIKGNRRSTCRFCRYKRCLRLGMSREAIKTGRYSHRKRTSDIIEVKQLENTPGFPVDELDFDNVLDTLMAAHDSERSLRASEETEATLHERQNKHIRLRNLWEMDGEDADSAFTKIGKNGVSTALTEDKIIANSTIINTTATITSTATTTTTTTKNINNSFKMKGEHGRHSTINSCSNANSGYSGDGATSPSLSSTSNDSGFIEDGLSTSDESEREKTAFHSHGPLDLSLKRKRENETAEDEEDKSIARQGIADFVSNDSIESSTSLKRGDFSADLTELSSLPNNGRASSEPKVICHDIADALVRSLCTDGTTDVRLMKGFWGDSDTLVISGCAQKRQRLERTYNMSEDAVGPKLLSGCTLARSREQDDHRSGHTEQHWSEGNICHEDLCSREASDFSGCSFGLRTEQVSGIDPGNENDTGGGSGLCRSTVRVDHDGVSLVDKELSKNTSLKAAKRWVAGYINFAKMIPGFIDLPAQTKGVLLRQAWDEVWMLQAFSGYNGDLGIATMPSGKCFFQDEMDKEWGQENTQVAFDVARVIKRCRLTQEMLVLLKAICIISPDRCPHEGRDKAEQIHWCLVTCVFKLIKNIKSEDLMTFPKLVTVLTSLRNLSETVQRNRQDGCLNQSFGSALFPDCLNS